jgi:hypothetical protein
MEEIQADVDDTISLEDTLESLKRNANAVDVHLQEARKKLKAFQHKVSEESLSLRETPLQPRTRMMKWLTDRQLPIESSFVDFFEVFVEEHKKESRLDISSRTLYLNTDAVVLFGYKEKEVTVHLYDLLEKLNILYY